MLSENGKKRRGAHHRPRKTGQTGRQKDQCFEAARLARAMLQQIAPAASVIRRFLPKVHKQSAPPLPRAQAASDSPTSTSCFDLTTTRHCYVKHPIGTAEPSVSHPSSHFQSVKMPPKKAASGAKKAASSHASYRELHLRHSLHHHLLTPLAEDMIVEAVVAVSTTHTHHFCHHKTD